MVCVVDLLLFVGKDGMGVGLVGVSRLSCGVGGVGIGLVGAECRPKMGRYAC